METSAANPKIELALALALIGFSGVIFVGAAGLPEPRFEPLGSAAVPRMLAGLMACLSAIWVIRLLPALRKAHPAPAAPLDPEAPKPHPGLAVAVLLAVFAFVAVMDFGLASFKVAGIGFVILCGFLLTHRDLRKLPWIVGYAVVLVLACDFAFTRFFYINLP
ncbi:putative tricarboxylic transport membrane protein [Primorskyibacter sedentarius]|uniref:Putative tricarboxylic transport membrane protein n=1 Tax=Primorskyibacter sedentarius TaxID=745311 RepID=A0A4V2UMK4_9RHOB|nr:tripartite tricarboxylate transporter TctB family protein [Primorskyibacter sedentarius]TCS57235.1 putative tricarboxylic transport membrane protein [Primorskyibacter sedentarius]